MEYYEFQAMNTDVVLAAEASWGDVTAGFQAVQRFIERSEAALAGYAGDSELAQLNAAGGALFPASAELFEIVRLALACARQTRGVFDPTISTLPEVAGFEHSTGSSPYSWEDVQLDESVHGIVLPPGTRLHLGGIAKGWIAEHAALILSEFTPACAVDMGGIAAMVGLPEAGAAWKVALPDPIDPLYTRAMLTIGSGSVATFFAHHNRQGEPVGDVSGQAQGQWLSVTVVGHSAAEAQVFARALLTDSSFQAPLLVDERPDLDFIAVDGAGTLWGSPHAQALLEQGSGVGDQE